MEKNVKLVDAIYETLSNGFESQFTKEESIEEKIIYLLKGNYSCGRTWEAWQVGTMSEADFAPLEEDEELVNSLVALCTSTVLRKHIATLDTQLSEIKKI